jgi:hypothetical protein
MNARLRVRGTASRRITTIGPVSQADGPGQIAIVGKMMERDKLQTQLQLVRERRRRLGRFAGLCWGSAASVSLIAVLSLADLTWDLPAAVRLLTPVLAVVILVLMVIGASRRERHRSSDRRIAYRLDNLAAARGEIVAGFDMSQVLAVRGTIPITHGLAEIAVRAATDAASAVPHVVAAPAQSVRTALKTLSAIGLVLLLIALANPRRTWIECLRFLDPLGDHPPYSATILNLQPGDARIRYGDPLEVRVETEGPSVDAMELVITRGNASSPTILPMFQESSTHWRTTVSTVTDNFRYFARIARTRTEKREIQVITVPDIEELRVQMVPPEYTRDPVYDGPISSRGIIALAGTTITITARSNRPLSGGIVQLPGSDDSVSMTSASAASREVVGRFVVRESGEFKLDVTDVDGQTSARPYLGTIQCLSDQRPFVRFLEPAAQSFATPTIELPLALVAEDDYGVAGLEFHYQINDAVSHSKSVAVATPPGRRQETQIPFSLADLGVSPGDQLKIFARVVDNDPQGGKGSESSLITVQIISDEEFERMLRAREGLESMIAKYDQAQRQMEQLADALDRLREQLQQRDPAGELSDGERERIAETEQRMRQVAEAIRESASQDHPYDLDQSLKQELQRLADQIEATSDDFQRANAAPGQKAGDAARNASAALDQLRQQRRDFQQDVNQPLDALAKAYPLLEDQYRFAELAQRQTELAQRLSSLDGHDQVDDPVKNARMRELEDEQRQLRSDLDQLLTDIDNHALQLPSEIPELEELSQSAKEFANAVRNSQATPAMTEAEQGLAERSGTRGHQQSARAADELNRLIGECQANAAECKSACQQMRFGPMKSGLGETLDQLLRDAGFRPGSLENESSAAPGQSGSIGAGGGSSARRSALNNVGLYGRIPATRNPTQSGSGKRRQLTVFPGGHGDSVQGNRGSALDPHGLLRASGIGESAIPARYRSRVQKYFERIADEAGGRK